MWRAALRQELLKPLLFNNQLLCSLNTVSSYNGQHQLRWSCFLGTRNTGFVVILQQPRGTQRAAKMVPILLPAHWQMLDNCLQVCSATRDKNHSTLKPLHTFHTPCRIKWSFPTSQWEGFLWTQLPHLMPAMGMEISWAQTSLPTWGPVTSVALPHPVEPSDERPALRLPIQPWMLYWDLVEKARLGPGTDLAGANGFVLQFSPPGQDCTPGAGQRHWGNTRRLSSPCHKAREGPVYPASNKDHGQHIDDIPLHHIHNHSGVCQWISGVHFTLGFPEEATVRIVEKMFAHEEALSSQESSIFPEEAATSQNLPDRQKKLDSTIFPTQFY